VKPGTEAGVAREREIAVVGVGELVLLASLAGPGARRGCVFGVQARARRACALEALAALGGIVS
jgi:hypothetical protein